MRVGDGGVGDGAVARILSPPLFPLTLSLAASGCILSCVFLVLPSILHRTVLTHFPSGVIVLPLLCFLFFNALAISYIHIYNACTLLIFLFPVTLSNPPTPVEPSFLPNRLPPTFMSCFVRFPVTH